MKFTLSLLLPLVSTLSLTTLALTTNPAPASKRQDGPDGPACNDPEAPLTQDQKAAAQNFVIAQVFGTGEFCPEGCSVLECPPSYCAICQGAYISITNGGDDGAGRCLTTEDFNGSMEEFGLGDLCVDNVNDDEYMQVFFAALESVTLSDECTNVC